LELDLSDMVVVTPSPREFVPAPGQGVMAIQTRKTAIDIRKQLAPLHHLDVGECTNVERTVLNMMEGGCSMPLGVYCEKDQLGNYRVWAAYAENEHGPVKRVQLALSTRAGLAKMVVEALRTPIQ
jgi:hydroxymethylbilane synthase